MRQSACMNRAQQSLTRCEPSGRRLGWAVMGSSTSTSWRGVRTHRHGGHGQDVSYMAMFTQSNKACLHSAN